VTRADGFMDCWDILQKQKDPILSIKVQNSSMSKIEISIKRIELKFMSVLFYLVI